MDRMGEMPEVVRMVLQNYVPQVTLWVVWGVAVIVAIARWRKHPKVSMLVLAAGCVDIATGLAAPLVYLALSRYITETGLTGDQLTLVFSAVNFAIWGVHGVALALLLAAALGWRPVPLATRELVHNLRSS